MWLLLATEPLRSSQPRSPWKEGGEGKRLRHSGRAGRTTGRALPRAGALRFPSGLVCSCHTKGHRALGLGVTLSRERQITGAFCECNMAAGSRRLGSFSPPERRGPRTRQSTCCSFPRRESALLVPPIGSPAGPRAASRVDPPRLHPSVLCSPLGRLLTLRRLSMETLEDSDPGWDSRPCGRAQSSLAFPISGGAEPPLVGWLTAREAQLAVSPPPS